MNINETLKHYFGYDSLRPGQQELIEGILQRKDVLGIMPTGAGKSLCYQVPALMLDGITIVVSPLISLMTDQVKALNQAGVHAAYINSSLTENQIRTALFYAAQGRYKIIYVAPERLNTIRFLEFACQVDISMVTVDEAHCISQWGQDLRLQNPVTVVTGFDRPNLFFRVVTRKGGKETDNSVLNYVKKHGDESGIIYCATKKNADKIYGLLQQYGIEAGHYHAGLSLEERKKNQDDFTYDRIRVMVATNAFGMGIDKSNVRYVLHYNMPQSLEYYYQEAGRAGRDGEEAECVLFFSKQDIMINKRLLEYKSTESIESDPQVRRNDYQKLNRMIDYCETQQCLRQFILSYFGDNSPCTCDKCSNCVVVEDEEEENYIQTKKEKKKAFQLANLTPKGQELFEQLRKCRTELAAEKGVPPYIICSDKTLTDMCAKCPADNEDMETVYGMGVQKIQSYGEHFTKIIIDFLEEQSAAGGADAETLQLTTELTPEQIEETTGITVAASPAREKKLPFYIAPGKLDEVELTDTCMISELTNRINELCDEEDQKNRKKLTAAFVNTLLIQKGYIEEATEGEEKVKHITEKGKEAGIQEEERYGKYGRKYYALVHTRESQEMILGELREYLADLTDE